MKLPASYPAVCVLALLLFCFSDSALSQSSLFSYETHVSQEGDTLLYRQMMSDYAPGTKYPLVIFLHGSGERGNDNEAQLKWGVRNFASAENMKQNPCILIAPQCPQNDQWGNFNNILQLKDSPTKSMTLLVELINKLVKDMPVDKDRVYITGLSMGGFGTFDIISRHPDLFAAAVPVCGGGDVSKASLFSQIPIWIFHGAVDGVVSPDLSQQMLNALSKEGANPGYTQYPEVGHFAWIAAYSDQMMMNWLFRQRKN